MRSIRGLIIAVALIGVVVLAAACAAAPPPYETPSAESSTTAPPPGPSAPPTTVKPAARPYQLGEDQHTSFSSPSGRLHCSIGGYGVVCLIHTIDRSKLRVIRNCSGIGEHSKPSEVELSDEVRLACYNDLAANPRRNEGVGDTDWVEAVGRWARINGDELAVLPYGAALKAGDFVCTSEEFGTTCVNVKTQHGFLVRFKGLVTF